MTDKSNTQFLADGTAADQDGFINCGPFPHLSVEIPDGKFAITLRTSDGRRVALSFMSDKGQPQANFMDLFVADTDIEIHDGRRGLPAFHAKGFSAGSTTFDTRLAPFEALTALCIFLKDPQTTSNRDEA